MIRINLLPYKEEIRKAKRQQFYSMAVLSVIFGVLVVGLIWTIVGAVVSNQLNSNKALQDAIDAAKAQVEEIAKIKAQTQALLGRKNAIETLQSDRGSIVHLLSELVRQTPEGTYLTSIKQTGRSVTVNGYTQSNAHVSTFMRNIDASNWMASSQLIEIKASTTKIGRSSPPEFSLSFQLVPDKSATAAQAAKGGEES